MIGVNETPLRVTNSLSSDLPPLFNPTSYMDHGTRDPTANRRATKVSHQHGTDRRELSVVQIANGSVVVVHSNQLTANSRSVKSKKIGYQDAQIPLRRLCFQRSKNTNTPWTVTVSIGTYLDGNPIYLKLLNEKTKRDFFYDCIRISWRPINELHFQLSIYTNFCFAC